MRKRKASHHIAACNRTESRASRTPRPPAAASAPAHQVPWCWRRAAATGAVVLSVAMAIRVDSARGHHRVKTRMTKKMMMRLRPGVSACGRFSDGGAKRRRRRPPRATRSVRQAGELAAVRATMTTATRRPCVVARATMTTKRHPRRRRIVRPRTQAARLTTTTTRAARSRTGDGRAEAGPRQRERP